MPGSEFAMLVDRKATLDADTRSALHLLASAVDGYPESLFQAHGLTPKLIQTLVHAGHVAITISHARAGDRVMAVRRMRITDAGRRALGRRDALPRRSLAGLHLESWIGSISS